MKAWLGTLVLLLGSCAFALIAAEGASRWLQPVETGVRHLAPDGSRIGSWLVPGSAYRQVSNEFDAFTTIAAQGHRGPDAGGSPDVVFVGDSFTFGWGLADDETFAALYCRERALRCANLGAPGTGTLEQMIRLESYLSERGWRPREVKLFVFAMTGSFSAGNDLADNYAFARRRGAGADAAPRARPGALERLLGMRREVLRHSNLVRLAKYYWGPLLRSSLVPGLDRQRLEESLTLTGGALQQLDQLSGRYGFRYAIYALHPVQDVARRTHEDTRAALERVAPAPVRGTAQLFEEDPPRFYYGFDGHLNAAGSRRIAELLIAEAGPRA